MKKKIIYLLFIFVFLFSCSGCIKSDVMQGIDIVTTIYPIDYITNTFVGNIKIMEPTKIDEWKWFSIEELPENIYSPSKKCIEYYLENKRRNED